METITKEQAKVAAEWWTNAIKTPVFDNGDRSYAGGVGAALAAMLAAKTAPDGDKYDRFQQALEERLTDASKWTIVDVDYHPGHVLSEVADACEIHPSQFPWKTTMWFHDGGVQVRAGYGGETVELMGKE